jgi:predicted N-acetyltransferase YhbS
VSSATTSWDLGVAGTFLHQALDDDLEAVAGILEDAARWVESLGVPSWEPGTFHDPSGRGRKQLLEAVGSNALFLARIGEEPVATVSLFDVDERFWPGAPADALYVHKLAVRRAWAGRDIGGAILRWSMDRARARGKAFLRLDCPRDDLGVRTYYERHWFQHRGDLTVGTFEASLYELRL